MNGRFILLLINFITKYKFSILFFIYLLLITYFQGVGIRISNLLFLLSIFFALHLFSKTKISLLFVILFSLFLSIDAIFAFIFHGSISYGIAASIIETNENESMSMFRELWYKVIPIILVSGLLTFKAQNEIKKSPISRKISLLVILCIWVIFIPGYIFSKIIENDRTYRDFQSNPIPFIQHVTETRQSLIINSVATFISYYPESEKIEEYKDTKKILPKGIVLNKEKELIPKIYIVVGESAGREYFSLYGYPISSTPLIDNLAKNHPEKVHFYKGLSSAPITRDAISCALTFRTPRNETPYFTEKNVIELANDAAYTTFWISNQDKFGLHETPIGLISITAHNQKFNIESKNEDLDLVSILESEIRRDEKQLFIIHLSGSHLSYKGRYDDADEMAIKGDDGLTDYLRTIHHTDRVLSNIYDLAEQIGGPYVILYFSDHGEIVGKGHGFIRNNSNGDESKQFEIPIISINNTTLPIDSIFIKYTDPKTQLLNNTNVIYILAELMNYEISQEVIDKAVEDGKYIYHVNNTPYLFEDIVNKDQKKE